MILNHAGTVNKDEEQAFRFYRDFLGLNLTRKTIIPKELCEQLFSVSSDITMLVFDKEGAKIEVFICPECEAPSPDFRHVGLLLDNFSEITEKAPKEGVELIVGRTKDKSVYFLKDFSGNLVEIKQI